MLYFEFRFTYPSDFNITRRSGLRCNIKETSLNRELNTFDQTSFLNKEEIRTILKNIIEVNSSEATIKYYGIDVKLIVTKNKQHKIKIY